MTASKGSPLSAANLPAVNIEQWRENYERAVAGWHAVIANDQARDASDLLAWGDRLRQMRSTQQELVAAGRWRGGPRTLLAAIDVQYRELAMTAALAWLLRPDGHHGLGTGVLAGLLTRLGIGGSVDGRVRITVEELRTETRADLVVYGSDWTIVVEAKTYAPEQERQLDRLYLRWKDEAAPSFVFLTRGARDPRSAHESHAQWRGLTWREVATLIRNAAATRSGISAGVHDYLETLEAYHLV
ncbi:PD-(D/E)XK nuclease family protein [Jatrophihabitans sp.]|jgi:hypothetical protein|uniref:PD-(D/E)XK nuclease family protein n=1 Tax=Jatrophihabitans sp. TaxID=1932789 RepID=UPI002EE6F12B